MSVDAEHGHLESEAGDTSIASLTSQLKRRNFLHLLMGGATALVAGLVSACHPPFSDCLGSPCCHPAKCNFCHYVVSRDRFNCDGPGEFGQRRLWTCEAPDGRLVWCGECASGPTCFDEPFACSTWFYN